jgi:hypothetical protein
MITKNHHTTGSGEKDTWDLFERQKKTERQRKTLGIYIRKTFLETKII